MLEWKLIRLGDICITNKNSYSSKDNWKFVNYLDTGSLTENKITELQYINIVTDKIPSRARRKVIKNSILYSTVRPNQLHYGIIKEPVDNLLVSTGFTVIDVDINKAIPEFVYYLLTQNNTTEQLQAIAEQSVSTYPSIKPSDIENLEFKLPNLIIQSKIVSILGTIDSKIRQNEKINNNLEQQAQAIFKSWFVDFEPFNKLMPSDWTIGTIDDLAKEVVCGKTPSTKKAEYYGSDIPFITIPDMHGKTYMVTTERYLSKLGASSQEKKSLPKNSICVSCIGTAGLVTLVAEESQTNQQINSIIPKESFSPYYIYLLMQTLSDTINKLGQSGSTIVNLNKSQFGKIQVIIPALSSMIKFDKIVSPMFEKILQNQIANLKLTSLRDTLLPKLMSGELDASNIDL